MKKYSIILTYLDLIFLLFAVAAAFNLVLAVSKGRTPHQLEKDFILVEITWHESRSPQMPWDAIFLQANEGDRIPAPFSQPADFSHEKEIRSVHYWAPLPAGTWRLEIPADQLKHVKCISYATRKGRTPELNCETGPKEIVTEGLR